MSNFLRNGVSLSSDLATNNTTVKIGQNGWTTISLIPNSAANSIAESNYDPDVGIIFEA